MKKVSMLLIAAIALNVGIAGTDDSDWLRIMTDAGTGATLWQMTSDYSNPQKKKLNCEISPAEIKGAAVEYEIQTPPYDGKLKIHITAMDHPWGDVYIKVNGATILDAPAGPYIGKGLHRVEFKPELLKEGENLIEIGWKRHQKDSGKVYGYIYFAVDKSEREIERRKLPRDQQGTAHNDDLRIRLLLKLQ